MAAGTSVRTGAGAELNLALGEVLLEFCPFVGGWLAVFAARP